MPQTKEPNSGIPSEDETEEKPIVPSAALRASLAKFSFPSNRTTPPKPPPETDFSRTSQQRSPTRGVKRKRHDISLSEGSSVSQTPSKRTTSSPTGRRNPGYASPETYAHLNYLEDHIKQNLDILFCGINPGTRSATVGHHFAHPTNQFYRALHKSGLTDRLLDPSEDWSMPDRYNLGLTNMVERPSSTASELSRAEKVAGVPGLLAKVVQYRPRIVCFIGREIGDAFETAVRNSLKGARSLSVTKTPTRRSVTPKVKSGKESPDIKASASNSPSAAALDRKAADYVSPLLATAGFGLLPYKLLYASEALLAEGEKSPASETLFFTAPSTSGRVQTYQLEDRVQLLRVLRETRNDVLSGSLDTSNMTIIPNALYNSTEVETTSRFFGRSRTPKEES